MLRSRPDIIISIFIKIAIFDDDYIYYLYLLCTG